MLMIPRLTLPGTIDISTSYEYAHTGPHTWEPTIITLTEASPDDETSEGSEYIKAQRSKLACLRCRSKKTKCDGGLPCNQCIKISKQCSYEERKMPQTSERALTEKLAILQGRYKTLKTAISKAAGTKSTSSSKSPPTKESIIPWSPGRTPLIEANITTEIRDSLLKISLLFLPRCNFDISAPTIFAGLALPPAQQPHPAFINALMLLGTFYSTNSADQPLPEDCPPPEYFVQEIRAHMVNALADADRLMHLLTAGLMLSWWLLQSGAFIQGQFEVSTAARLAIHCGLHQIDEQTVKSVLFPESFLPPISQSKSLLGPPTSIEDLDARVSVFWGIYYGDRSAALMTGFPTAFDERTENPDLAITTVFPKRSGHFGDAWNPEDFCSIDDLMGFPQIPSAPSKDFRHIGSPQTVIGASGQATALLLHGMRLSCVAPQSLTEAQDLRNALIVHNQAIARFTVRIPRDVTLDEIKKTDPPYAFGARHAPLAYFAVAEVRCSAYVAIICMHQAAEQLQNFEGGQHGLAEGLGMGEDKKMAAAHATSDIVEEIFEVLSRPDCDITAKDGLCINTGYLWTIVAIVYIERIAKLRKGPPNNPEIQICMTKLFTVVAGIKRFASVFPILDLQYQKIETLIGEKIR